MKTKLLKHLWRAAVLLMLTALPLTASAYDFMVDGIAYNINNDGTSVSVTYTVYQSSNNYSGLITANIPSNVTYDSNNYSVTSISYQAFEYCSSLTSVTISNSVSSIGNYAFYGCSHLTSVTISNSVSSIGNHAFYGCSHLTSITIPNSVTSIGNYAFYGCNSLTNLTWNALDCSSNGYMPTSNITNVTIGSNVQTLPSGFVSGSKITIVDIPNSVTSIGRNAFSSCSNLTSVHITDLAAWCNISFSNENANPLKCAHHLYLNESEIQDLIIPNSITTINRYAFYNCSGLTSITIPNSVTSIRDYAFSGCSGLNGELVIPNSVTSIGYQAFYGCSGLSGELVIPNSVTIIDSGAFSGCSGLNGELVIPNSVTSIGYQAFYGCSGLSGELVIPNSVTSIGSNAFYSCSGLTSVTIGNSVTSIGDYAFSDCYGLTSITIPNSVTQIGNHAFYECSGLTSVYSHIHHPNDVDFFAWDENGSYSYIFDRLDYVETIDYDSGHVIINEYHYKPLNCTVFVTKGKVEEYRMSEYWKYYDIVEGNWLWPVTNITMNDSVLNTTLNNTITLQVFIEPIDATVQTVNWTSSDESVASVNQNGVVIPHALGTTTITATTTDGSDLSASCVVHVIGATNIELNKNVLTLYENETDTLVATITPDDVIDNTIAWQSSNTAVATVDQDGVVTAHSVGDATITATTNDGTNLSDSCLVEVRAYVNNITLNKTQLNIYVGGNDSIVATVLPENAYNKTLIWQSSDTTVATVDQNGKISAVSLGTAIITATSTDGTNLSASCVVNVTGITKITLNKTFTNIYVGGTETLTATVTPSNVIIKTLLWHSSDTTVATVDQNGKISALKLGQTVITASATDGSNVIASCTVNVTGITSIALNKTSSILYLNDTDNLTATITPANVIIKTITWQSSNPSVASVDQNGKVTAHAVGTAIITATTTDGTNLSAQCTVEVRAYVNSLTLNKNDIEMYVGGSETITATVLPTNAYNKTLMWQSSNLSVASVNQNGRVTANSPGTALIIAKTTDGTNLIATCGVTVTGITSLTLNKTEITLFAGTSETLIATIMPTDVIVSTLNWQSSEPTIATVNQNGKITALSAGTVTITATTTDGTNLSASCVVTVWPQYALVAPVIEHTRGEQPLIVEYPVEMLNKNLISGLQFEMQLPDGVSLMNDSYGYPDVWLDDYRRARNHSIDVTELGSNRYQVLISSPTNREFKDNSGNLFYMRLLIDQYHVSGIYYITLSDIVLAEADETEHQAEDANFNVQYNYMLGDADADVHVDVADYITTALYILSRPTLRFYEDAANVHTANSAINVTDLTGITNIALGIRPIEIVHAPSPDGTMPANDMEPEMNVNVRKLDADRWMMSIDMNNHQSMAAMQLDLKLPDGVIYESAGLTERADKLQLTDGILPDGTLRLLVSAFSADDIEAGSGEVLNVILRGNPYNGGMATFGNITVAERNLNSYELESMTVPFTPTAVDGVIAYNEVRIYGENGNVIIESPVAGTAQLVLINGISTPLKVQAGRNVYPVESNEYYIVRFNGITAKLRF